jgi:hypothetical protein
MACFRESRIWPMNPNEISPFSFPTKAGREFNSWKIQAKGVKTETSVQNKCKKTKPKTNLRSFWLRG